MRSEGRKPKEGLSDFQMPKHCVISDASDRRPLRRCFLFPWLALWLLVAMPAYSVSIDPEEWLWVRTPHFSLLTNADAERGAEIVLGLEQFRAAFAQLAPSLELNSPTPTQLFAFRDPEIYADYKRGMGAQSVRILGQFISHFDASYITLDASALQRGALGVIQHEYVHHFVRYNFPRVPLWFNEGLAEYYSTFTTDGETALLGMPVEAHLQRLRRSKLDLSEVLAVDHRARDTHKAGQVGAFYSTSWGLMHYLLASGERLDKTADYLIAVHSGEDPEEAFEAAFGARLSSVEEELAEYLTQGELEASVIPIARLKSSRDVRVERPSVAEVYYYLGDLQAHVGRLEEAESHFQLALDHHPDHPESIAGLAWIRDAQQRYEEASWLHQEALEFGAALPQNHLAYGRHLLMRYRMRLSLDDSPREQRDTLLKRAAQALERAIEIDSDYGEARALLGQTLATQNDFDGSLRQIKRARNLLPARDDLVHLQVKIHIHAQQLDAAEQLLETELAFRVEDSVVEDLRQEIHRQHWLGEAQEAIEAGEVERGLELFDQAISATKDIAVRERMEEQLRLLQEKFEL